MHKLLIAGLLSTSTTILAGGASAAGQDTPTSARMADGATSTKAETVGVAGTDAERAADRAAEAMLNRMTQEEKLQLVHGGGWDSSPIGAIGHIRGVPRLGIPNIDYLDSTAGPNAKDKNATPLPNPLALAASWDRGLAEAYGTHIATELRVLGFSGALGGGINLAREPRNGRTFEYQGEDPVLAGEMLAARIRGNNRLPMLTTAKHFIMNDQETNRFTSNSVIGERPFRELYLRAFEIAVKEGRPASVMCAYNLVNGVKSCENRLILTDILKGEWGFKGFVQGDWALSITDTARAANAGTDEEQPGSTDNGKPDKYGLPTFFNQKLGKAVADGRVPQSRLDDMVRRKLRMLYLSGIMASPPHPGGTIDTVAGDRLALKVAQESIVLLKNDGAAVGTAPVLPLDRTALSSIAVIGGHADKGVISGGGSGSVPPRDGNAVECRTPGANVLTIPLCANWYRSSPLTAIRNKVPQATVTYLDGDNPAAAADAAARADVAIVFATQFLLEQVDLKSLALPDGKSDPANQFYDQEALIAAVAAKAKRTVVVLENGTAVLMPWAGKVNAIVDAWYPGVKGGDAIADVLFGDVNPSGKLPLTFPNDESELPQPRIPEKEMRILHEEGLNMGYRRYDALKTAPLFAFGHGLSYTKFTYSGLTAKQLPSGAVRVRFTLRNAGSRAGAEVAQIYAAMPAAANEPPQRLVGWQKVTLTPGARRTVSLTIPTDRFTIWSGGWRVPAGEGRIIVGGSSRDPQAVTSPIRFVNVATSAVR